MKNKTKQTFNLTIRFTFQIFFISVFYAIITAVFAFVLHRFGIISFVRQSPITILFLFLLSSAVIGFILAVIISKRSFFGLNKILNAVSRIGKGDFDVEIKDMEKPEFLVELANNINIMAAELKNLEIMRNDFVQNFSHEFKTPIVSIQGFAKRLLTKDLDDAQKKDYLKIIYEESARLSLLSENTLIMSKLESLERVSDKKVFKLDEQIRQAVLLFEKDWSQKNLDINVQIQDDLEYFGDEQILKQVWINILDNAIKFSNHSGEIKITLKKEQKNVVVSISDNGIGMDETTKNQIFNKYFQADKSRATQGNGLGLAIVKKIVNLCNGEIKVTSFPDIGTTFSIILPQFN